MASDGDEPSARRDLNPMSSSSITACHGSAARGAERLRADAPEIAVVMFTLDEDTASWRSRRASPAFVPKDTPLGMLWPRSVAWRSPSALLHRHRRAWWSPQGALRAARSAPRAAAACDHIARVLIVVYAGAFLVAEPVFGASAAILAVIPVAVAGAIFGPRSA